MPPYRLYDPAIAKRSTPGEDAKWTLAFFVAVALPIAAVALIIVGLIALL